jgi:hypothetical protein
VILLGGVCVGCWRGVTPPKSFFPPLFVVVFVVVGSESRFRAGKGKNPESAILPKSGVFLLDGVCVGGWIPDPTHISERERERAY